MKKIFSLAIYIMAAFSYVQAQESDETPQLYKVRNKATEPTTELEPYRPLQFNMQAGTSVGVIGRNHSFWSNYLAPQASYQLGRRWNLNVGTMFSYTQFGTTARGREAGQPSPNGYFQNFVYAQGQYLVNPRLQLTGTAFYETTRFNGLTMNPQATNLQSKGLSMHADYKVSEHFSIGAGVQISNGNSYLGNGLYQSPAYFPRAGRFNSGW
ncbi:hypothetical protein GXP67_28390 [Rhodocytophaga rosea]|uniref:Porin family protein n=1 Tax=Rhodocytophaga rosea TaxID=2704465 RepID=A0A6C0GRX0_9BACT|nr:hypothetical protein [Rhodocytophaga rosea]QHT70292.1 hypothetical protein GXP67_28390 [Rhodocytophaga rosea]